MCKNAALVMFRLLLAGLLLYVAVRCGLYPAPQRSNAAVPSAAPSLAQSGFEISWWTVDGGGGSASGGGYTLSGTGGQADAGLLTGGAFTLGGGFWCGGATALNRQIYLPLVMRNLRP